ncbi:hypothetical protein GMORB2_1868 [Geosmithia morbida]|uniref:Uncharacterized protein n=1 Tax=Geosmithia morbida TaxID=1094350 RepID=A0A9P4YQV9_9HYPO|nr:uncharacterized protein GMORB2_1868 [Geosmithia morbida]KAF4121461.1 hypothetical protein GMORB2_1868 [Geosmithia morbida]
MTQELPTPTVTCSISISMIPLAVWPRRYYASSNSNAPSAKIPKPPAEAGSDLV